MARLLTMYTICSVSLFGPVASDLANRSASLRTESCVDATCTPPGHVCYSDHTCRPPPPVLAVSMLVNNTCLPGNLCVMGQTCYTDDKCRDLPKDQYCFHKKHCPKGLVCFGDNVCRNKTESQACFENRCPVGQTCFNDGVCYPTPGNLDCFNASLCPAGLACALDKICRVPNFIPGPGFDPERDSLHLKEALDAWGVNMSAVIERVTARSNQQLRDIAKHFQVLYHAPLVDYMTERVTGSLGTALSLLFSPPDDALLLQLNQPGHMGQLTEMFCGKRNAEIKMIAQSYSRLFKKPLTDQIRKRLRGHLATLLLNVAKAERDEVSTEDLKLARLQARRLHEMSFSRANSVSELVKIFTQVSYAQLRAILEEYKTLSKNTLKQYLLQSNNIRPDFAEAIEDFGSCSSSVPGFYARQLHDAIYREALMDEDSVFRIVISRREIDLEQIKQEYLHMYRETLRGSVMAKTYGHFQAVFVGALIGREHVGLHDNERSY